MLSFLSSNANGLRLGWGWILLCVMLAAGPSHHVHAQRDNSDYRPLPRSWTFGFDMETAGVGSDLTSQLMNYKLRPVFSASVGYHVSRPMALYMGLLGGVLANEQELATSEMLLSGVEFSGRYLFDFFSSAVYPFIELRTAVLLYGFDVSYVGGDTRKGGGSTFAYGGGLGVRICLDRGAFFNVRLHSLLTLTDRLDGIAAGLRHDGFTGLSVGLEWVWMTPGER